MKRWLILLLIIAALFFGLIFLKGIALVIFLMVFVPLTIFYSPLLFGFDKKEELTEEAKREKEGKFHKWE